MSSSSPTEGPNPVSETDFATLVITRVVDPGRQEDFRQWLARLMAEAEKFPHNSGTVVLSPSPGQPTVFRVVQRFVDAASLKAWEDSGVRRRLSAEADAFSTSQRQVATGLETWFQLDDDATQPPPAKWKMAVVTFAAAYVLTAILIPLEVRWFPESWPFLAVNVVTNALLATLMTYLVMPYAARVMRRWLYRGQ